VDIFCLHELVTVCDHKNIACYRERTAITSLNKQMHARHKKVVIWQESAGGKQDIFSEIQVECSPCKYLYLTDFVLQKPDFILQMPDFRAHKN